jgi:glutamate-1-semialdehyde aminotransferase
MADAQIFTEAKTLLPGGVNSPVRAFRSVGGQPIVFDRVKGAYCWDVDGNKYVDYVGSWGPAIVGHANDEVNDAVVAQLQKGASFGAPCELEVSAMRIAARVLRLGYCHLRRIGVEGSCARCDRGPKNHLMMSSQMNPGGLHACVF